MKKDLAARIRETRKESTKLLSHVVVEALAGTGKTFTLIVGVAYAFLSDKGWERFCKRLGFTPVPSPEQKVIWERLKESRGRVRTIKYGAFNRSIVGEFSDKWGWLVKLLADDGITLQFATINSIGNQAIYAAYGRLRVSNFHTSDLIARLLNRDIRELRRQDSLLISATDKLVGLCKLTLAGWDEEMGFRPENVTEDVLDELVAYYDVDMNGSKERVYKLVPQVLAESLKVQENQQIDFNDQNWLPIVQNLPVQRSDLFLADEAQDLPRCKQEFIRKVGRRIFAVGDVWQAIYGFAGADTESIPRLRRLLSDTEEPLESLSLTVTYRCGKSIVREAQKIVPGFTAHEDNSEGIVEDADHRYSQGLLDGDMVLSRVNAPLISQALRLIKSGRKAVVRGRDFGGQLKNFITRLDPKDVNDLIEKVDRWYDIEAQKEARKKNPSEARLIALEDRKDCIEVFTEGAETVQQVLDKLDLVFAGKECPQCHQHFNEQVETCYKCKCKLINPKGVLFSSVHRAKGLEAKNVYIYLQGAPMPHPMAKSDWQRQQEMNLLYVARTRAIEKLVYVN